MNARKLNMQFIHIHFASFSADQNMAHVFTSGNC